MWNFKEQYRKIQRFPKIIRDFDSLTHSLYNLGRFYKRYGRWSVAAMDKTHLNLRYEIATSTQQLMSRKKWRETVIDTSFYTKRAHIWDSPVPRTNHCMVAMLLFCKLIEKIQKKILTICEFGVWRGAWLENLAIWADENHITLNLLLFDTFSEFPLHFAGKETSFFTSEYIKNKVINTKPFSKHEIEIILKKYSSVSNLQFFEGDITEYARNEKIKADFFHVDVDFGKATTAALNMIDLDYNDPLIVVDDYNHPVWPCVAEAVDGFCVNNNREPINIADYCSWEKPVRSQWIYLLLPKKEPGGFS